MHSPTAAPPFAGPRLVLASASPARRRTLIAAGVDPLVVVSDVDEDKALQDAGLSSTSDPRAIVALLAKAKADDVAAHHDLPGGALVLGCDSMLELDGHVLGKPATAEVATQRWRAMRGRTGVLHTGHHLIATHAAASGRGVASTRVHFADVSDAEIAAYVATGEPLAVAGAFTIDGLGAAFVSRIEGDHHNVVGVSVPLLRELCGQLGVPWTSLWQPSQ